ncbi:MAG TPA: YoaK family protein [Polyangiaceae bacterium]
MTSHSIPNSKRCVASVPPSGRFRRPEFDDRVRAALLSSVAGYVDTAAFLTLFGLYPAHLTGDLVAIGAGIARATPIGLAARIAVVPFFMFSVVAAAVVARAFRRHNVAPVAPLLGLMTVALSAFLVAGVLLGPFNDGPDNWAVILTGCPAIAAMGIQNTIMREIYGRLCPTTMMTGNLTQFTMDLAQLGLSKFEGNADHRARTAREARRRMVKFGVPIAAFLTGAVLSGWLTGLFGLGSIAVPAATVAALTVVAWRRSPQRVTSVSTSRTVFLSLSDPRT